MTLSMLEAPPLRPTDIQPRPYQLEAISAIRDEFRKGHKSTLLVLPTGTGKTVVFGTIARRMAERDRRTLVLAHRGELIDQAVETLTRLGLDPGVEKAESYARALFEPAVVVATVQTMQGDRLLSWPRDYFRLVVVDEAHHAVSESYRRVIEHFGTALHLGVTATADRADGGALGEVYESTAFEYSLWDAMSAAPPGPYLSRLRFVQCDVGIDLRQIRTTAGDLNAGDLEEAIRPHIDTLANAIRQEIGPRKTVVFTPDVGSAQAMSSALNAIGVRARWVAGDSPDRRQIIEEFRHGEFQAICNCALLTEGFDCPDIEAIALCRPTKSRALYAQMAGRGTRLAPGKENCLLIDFAWLTSRHKLVQPVELFANRTDEETLKIAAKYLDRARGLDIKEVVERAKEEQELKHRVELHVQAQERQLRYRRVSFDPLAGMQALGIPIRKEADNLQGTITPRQRELLERRGFTGLDSMSKSRARAIIVHTNDRFKKGLATFKQVTLLIRLGVAPDKARSMTKEEASETITRFLGKAG